MQEIDTNILKFSVAQFLLSNDYLDSFESFLREAKIIYYIVDDKSSLFQFIQEENWKAILKLIKTKRVILSDVALSLLFEQIILFLCRNQEYSAARNIFLSSKQLQYLQETKLNRYNNLAMAISKKTADFDVSKLELIQIIEREVIEIGKDKLLHIFANSMKLEALNSTAEREIRLGKRLKGESNENEVDKKRHKVDPFVNVLVLKQSIDIEVELTRIVIGFIASREFLLTFSKDGFIEFWDPVKGEIDNSFTFQQQDKFLVHAVSVLALGLCISKNTIVTGDKNGTIKLWDIITGKCKLKIKEAHSKGVLSLCLSIDATTIFSGGHDGTIHIYGVKSGALINTLETGTLSFVLFLKIINNILFSVTLNGNLLVYKLSTGKIWFTSQVEWEALESSKTVLQADVFLYQKGVILVLLDIDNNLMFYSVDVKNKFLEFLSVVKIPTSLGTVSSFSVSGRYITVFVTKAIIVYNFTSGKEVFKRKLDHEIVNGTSYFSTKDDDVKIAINTRSTMLWYSLRTKLLETLKL